MSSSHNMKKTFLYIKQCQKTLEGCHFFNSIVNNFKNQETEFKSGNNFKISYFKKVVQPTKDEIEEHKKYLKVNLKKNNFN